MTAQVKGECKDPDKKNWKSSWIVSGWKSVTEVELSWERGEVSKPQILNTRRHFSPVRVTKHWHSLPREDAECPSWRYLKSIWTWPWTSCCSVSAWPERLDEIMSRGPFQLQTSEILWITMKQNIGQKKNIWPRICLLHPHDSKTYSKMPIITPKKSFTFWLLRDAYSISHYPKEMILNDHMKKLLFSR